MHFTKCDTEKTEMQVKYFLLWENKIVPNFSLVKES